ncbi:MAG: CheR family methyltransferase [Myxococcota bacterium]
MDDGPRPPARVRRLIVLGASAGGLEALTEVLSAVETSTSTAFVVALHLSAEHPSMMAEILDRRTQLRVVTVDGEVRLEPGTVYVIAPGSVLELRDAMVAPRPSERELRPTVIDRLFEQAAATWGAQATGVVLSGSGSDGARGAKAIVQAGGAVYCQSPSTARFDAMPTAVIRRGLATAVGTCAELGKWLEHGLPTVVRDTGDPEGPEGDAALPSAFWSVLERLREVSGIDFYAYRTATLFRRMSQRARTLGHAGLAAYASQAIDDHAELEHLRQRLLIGTTEFFRNPEFFSDLREHVIPTLVEQPTVRVWCAGCSTGEEAYSVAALFLSELEAAGSAAELRVFATDVRSEAIEFASRGSYAAERLASLPAKLRETYFVHDGHTRQARDRLRAHVLFAVHDVLDDPPFTKLDVVAFRNVMIYLRPEVHPRVLSRMHFALRPGGFLAVGESESTHTAEGLFQRVGQRDCAVLRKIGASKVPGYQPSRVHPRQRIVPVRREEDALGQLARRRLASSLGPPAVLLSSSGDVVHVLRDPAPYLRLGRGPVTMRAESLAPEPLGGVIAAALSKARRTGETTILATGPLDGVPPASVAVVPLGDDAGHLLLAFPPHAAPGSVPLDTEITELHRELERTRRSLEDSLTELQITNEELEATNEEMLATNEELEATNEELQATNEELHTVNAEREARIVELSELQEDVRAMLQDAGIAAVFVDQKLEIRRVIGPVSAYSAITQRDLGRPLGDIREMFTDVDLLQEVRTVLSVQRARRFQANLHSGSVVQVQVRPHISRSERGAMIVLLDESELASTKQLVEDLLDALPQHIAVIEPSGIISYTNRAWNAFAVANGLPASSSGVGSDYLHAIRGEEPSAVESKALFDDIFEGRRAAGSLDYPCHGPSTERWFTMHVARLPSGGAVVSHYDVSTRANAEARQRAERNALDRALRTMPIGVLLVNDEGRVAFANAHGAGLLGRTTANLVGAELRLLLTPDSHTDFDQAMTVRGRTVSIAVLHAEGRRVRALLRTSEHALQVVVLREPEESRGADAPLEMLSRLAGGVAHEINNALATVALLLDAWARDERIPEDVREDISHAREACGHGKDVTVDLLRFARPSDDDAGPSAVDATLRQVTSLVRASAGPGVRVTVHAETGAFIPAEPGQFSHALLNLVLNAVDAVADGGAVSIEASVGEDDLRPIQVVVRDDGVGMDEATRERIYEPFFSTKGAGRGTGLGLSLTHGFVRGAGGTIECQSSPGVGTTFTLRFPAADEPQPVVAHGTPTTLQGLRVLVVDDDELVRYALERMLGAAGAEVAVADGGAAALERLEGHDVVLLDVMMPGMSGYEVLREIRRRRPTLPAIMLTGDPSRIVEHASTDPFTRWELKPATKRELVAALTSLGVAAAR